MIFIWLLPLAIILVWAAYAYNNLIRQKNRVDEAWSGIDVQLTRRFDLVPNLVEVVKGYQQHEKSTLEDITALRSNANTPVERRTQRENQITGHLVRLFAVAEDYPDLRASENFQHLHKTLTELEDQLQYARRYYNGAVRDNNNLVEGFPSMLIARLFAFRLAEFFEIELASKRQVPEVDL